ncbi:murein transglycosylase/nitrite reductase transcriptional regulator [Neisseria animaloris]|uniref:lytic transglycosylase n=1 Tax=Neisseria animaloris TaxID=326522 RepID=UPI000A18AF22|nr:LysM peptidoglycan-binding domain-containing protein [Neisseria animaloris]OSI08341.1 lytic transglycosylase [Neisseria animaloris]VEH86725.1 murein transglycosylase/nitrite reductase transcriptional regulator [Neisseria animaloris]
MAKLKSIALAVTGVSAVSGAAYSHAAPSNQVGMAMMRLNSSLLDQEQKNLSSGSLWNVMRKDFRMAEVNSELVRRHESKFSAGRAYFDRIINRSKPYMYHIANEVKKRNMPAEIALLPFIESAFVTKAKSHVGASGLWQFMPATGRHFGLERTALYDGRHDVYAATNAALNYLEYLHRMFGDWSLALAAYNWGEGNVSRAINRARAQGLAPVYENLRMPAETRNYVPKLLAVRNIVKNPQAFGMGLSEIENKPYFKTVSIDKPIDTNAIARLANISESEFLALNPAFNAPVFVPKANRKLLLPVHATSTFEKNYRNARPETLISWDLYTAGGKTRLSKIAAEAGMSVAELKRLNNTSRNSLANGRNLLVAKGSINRNNGFNYVRVDGNTSITPDSYRENTASLQYAVSRTTLAANDIKLSESESAPIAIISNKPKASPETRIATSSTPISIAASLVAKNAAPEDLTVTAKNKTEIKNIQENVLAVAEPLPLPTQTSIAPAPEPAPSKPIDLAISEPLPLPNRSPVAAESEDALMALVNDTEQDRINAIDRIRNTLTQLEEETVTKARVDRIVASRTKQQQRTEARLARANAAAQQIAATTHRVAAGDTLFNISQRYNLSVADLITVNNIKGNSIRKGQILKVTAAPVQRNVVRNVSYTVRKGDTLNTIATRFNVDVNDIRRWNRNTRSVTPGQRLKLIGS